MNSASVIFILAALAFGVSSCSEQRAEEPAAIQPEVLPRTMQAEYQIRGFNHGIFVRLFSDGTFSHEVYNWGCTGGGSQRIVIGSFKETMGRVDFEPRNVIFNEYSEADFLTTDTLVYALSDSTKIGTMYFMVHLNGVEILVSNDSLVENRWTYVEPTDVSALANFYNSGKEVYLKKDLLATKDTLMRLDGLNIFENVPSAWRALFKPS